MYKKYKVGMHNHKRLNIGESLTNKNSDMIQIPIMRGVK